MLFVGVLMVSPAAELQAAAVVVVKMPVLHAMDDCDGEAIVVFAVVVIGFAVFMKYFSSLALMCLP